MDIATAVFTTIDTVHAAYPQKRAYRSVPLFFSSEWQARRLHKSRPDTLVVGDNRRNEHVACNCDIVHCRAQ